MEKKPCDHPKTEKEYYLGSDTGDKVCTTCGRVVGDDDFEKSKTFSNEPVK